MKREPVAIGGLVSIVVTLAASFGLTLTAEQVGATVSTVIAVVTFFQRRRVSPE